jgi:hypothetical protein
MPVCASHPEQRNNIAVASRVTENVITLQIMMMQNTLKNKHILANKGHWPTQENSAIRQTSAT